MFIIDQLKKLRKSLSARRPLIEIFIYKDNLLNNLRVYQKAYPGLTFAPVLKANAYGHGLEQVLKALSSFPVPFVALDSHFESLITGSKAPKMKALVIGYARPEAIRSSNRQKVSFTIVSLDQLGEIVAKIKNPKSFHLKLDTGMHRQGILPSQYNQAMELLRSNSNIRLEGLCSHLGDPNNEPETHKQIENWNSSVKHFKNHFSEIRYTHLSATSGLKFSGKIDANLVRLGIGFYGFDSNLKAELKPALEMRSLITGIKDIEANEKIGYAFSFTAQRPMKIATVPVGYFEGVDRRLSNKGYFKIGEEFCPLVGKLSMDIATIDISENKQAVFGGEIVIISAKAGEKNSIQEIAEICETVPYEILVHLPVHLKRTLV
ncbi:MAG: alanine racemase [Candidatus Doudnabacteria bacterium]|nr:alanine racemase [Candidatus Doudnabacteria bacterium]